MRIPPQHLPISVAGHESDLFDRKARFKKTARTFMSKVTKMKVFDFQIPALPNDATQRNLLSYVGFKGSYESVEFILCRPPVSFESLAN